jgi:hypothetical protein
MNASPVIWEPFIDAGRLPDCFWFIKRSTLKMNAAIRVSIEGLSVAFPRNTF